MELELTGFGEFEGVELLQKAWTLGRDDVVTALPESGVPGIPEPMRLGRELLAALRNDDMQKAVALLRQGADPNASDGFRTALLESIERRQHELAEALLAAGADPNRAALGDPPLVCAVREDPPLLAALLARGARVDEGRPRALMVAAELGDLETVKTLVAAGANLATKTDGRTPLAKAAEAGNRDVVEFLRHAGAPAEEVSILEWREKDVRLQDAARKGDAAQARFWLRHGADPNCVRMGTPLIAAVVAGHVELVKLLLEAGADPSMKSRTAEWLPTGREGAVYAMWPPASIKASLERRGMRIEDIDGAIAAHARALDATLVTANLDHMTRVPGLQIEDWDRR